MVHFSRSTRAGRGGYRKSQYTQNYGKPGVVYVLENDAFPHLLKIGQSTRSGAARAKELNQESGTGSPGYFRVLFEQRTIDCGRAEHHAHNALAASRFRKEYFRVSLDVAKKAVIEACEHFNQTEEELRREEARIRREQEERVRQQQAVEREAERRRQVEQEAQKKREADLRATQERERISIAEEPTSVPEASVPRVAMPIPASLHKDNTFGKNLLIVFAPIAIMSLISSLSAPSEQTAASQTSSNQVQPDQLSAKLSSYANSYPYPKPSPSDETTLFRVYSAGREVVFLYKTTAAGEAEMKYSFDPKHIRSAMLTLACSKPELAEFMRQGASVNYVLERASGERITQNVTCPAG